VLFGAGLSAFIELAQLLVPSRYPSLWDLGFNTAGAFLGVLLAERAPGLLAPPRRLALTLAIASLAGALLVLGGGATLFGPAGLHPPIKAQWTPETDEGEQYRGAVLTARLGEDSLPPGTLGSQVAPMRRVLGGENLALAFSAGPPPRAWVPLLRIHDQDSHAALTLAVRGTDVAFTYRTRSGALHLDQPEIRLPGALAGVEPGQRVRALVWAKEGGHCVAVEARVRCLRPSFGDTWSLLLYPVPRRLTVALAWLWPALLLFPAGFWLGRPAAAAAGAGMASGCLLLLAATLDLAPPGALLLAGLFAGSLAGGLVADWLRRRSARLP
jgi:hypothetical protein